MVIPYITDYWRCFSGFIGLNLFHPMDKFGDFRPFSGEVIEWKGRIGIPQSYADNYFLLSGMEAIFLMLRRS